MNKNNQHSIDVAEYIQSDIYKIIEELKRTTSATRVHRLLLALENLEKVVNTAGFDIKYPKEYLFEKSKYEQENDKLIIRMAKDYVYYAQEYKDFNKKITQIAPYIRRKYNIGSYNIYKDIVNIDETFKLTREFFKDYDQDMYDHFEDIANSPRAIIADLGNDGLSFLGNHVIKSYLLLNPYRLIDDSITLAHELIHTYFGDKMRYMSDYEDYLFAVNNMHEVYPIFIELVMEDYLLQNNIHTEDVIKTHNLRTKVFLSTLDQFKKQEYIGCSEERYTYGYLLAYYYYKQYKKDPKKTKENIFNLMIDSKTYERDYLFSHYGIDIDALTHPKLLERQLTKYMNKK